MKPSFVRVTIALCWWPAAVLAQPVHFNVQCLPPAQQQEIRSRAQVIQDAAEAQRASVRQQIGSSRAADLRADKEAKESAFSECSFKARAAGQWPGDVCVAQMSAFAAATHAYTEADGRLDRALQPIARDERRSLQELRDLYPSCPTTLLPDNPVIRK